MKVLPIIIGAPSVTDDSLPADTNIQNHDPLPESRGHITASQPSRCKISRLWLTFALARPHLLPKLP
jgi:hypothetical protein